MARIPEDEIAQLKQAVSIERLAEARGIVLKPHGADLMDRTGADLLCVQRRLARSAGA